VRSPLVQWRSRTSAKLLARVRPPDGGHCAPLSTILDVVRGIDVARHVRNFSLPDGAFRRVVLASKSLQPPWDAVPVHLRLPAMLHRQRQPSRLSSVRVVPSICTSTRVSPVVYTPCKSARSAPCAAPMHHMRPGSRSADERTATGGENSEVHLQPNSLGGASVHSHHPAVPLQRGHLGRNDQAKYVRSRGASPMHTLPTGFPGCTNSWQTDGISAPHVSLSTAGPPLVLLQRSSTVTTTPRCCISSAWTPKNTRWHECNCVEVGGGAQRGTSHPFFRRLKSSRKASSRRT
jgi:hypothetical protein